MEGLLSGVLPAIYSGADQIKRRVKGLLGDPREFLGQRSQDLQTLQDQMDALAYVEGLMSPQDPRYRMMAKSDPEFLRGQAELGRQQLMDVAMQGPVATKGGLLGQPMRSKVRVGTTGQYVGAPPGVDSPQKFGAIVADYQKAMQEGFAGRNFYIDSSKDLWARTGHNAYEGDLFNQNLATLSRSNNVGGNTTMSVKGHVQAVTGEPVRTGRFPTKDSSPIQEMYDTNKNAFLGLKRDPFATQLGVE